MEKERNEKERFTMTPYEATISGLDAGAASIRIELDNGAIRVYHGEDGSLLLHRINVKSGTWDKLWVMLENIGE